MTLIVNHMGEKNQMQLNDNDFPVKGKDVPKLNRIFTKI